MKDASIAVGLINIGDDFTHFFVLEPEIASKYFYYEFPQKAYRLTDFKEISFIFCDFWSKTVNIVTQQKLLNEYFIDRIINFKNAI